MDKWLLFVPGFIVVFVLAGVGFAIKYRKAYGLISGYNTMSEDKKKYVDIAGLARFIGNCMFVFTALVAAMLLSFTLGFTAGGIAALCLLLPCVIYAVIRAQRFDGNAKKPGGGYKAKAVASVAAVVLLLGGAAAFVAVMIGSSSKPIEYDISGGSLQIKCSFGNTVALKDITGLELLQTQPDISTRTWGSAVGDKLRGSFQLSDGTAAKVYVETANPPFIHFVAGGTHYYLNCAVAQDTNTLYEELRSASKP